MPPPWVGFSCGCLDVFTCVCRCSFVPSDCHDTAREERMNKVDIAAAFCGCSAFISFSSAACGALAPHVANPAHVVACRGCCAVLVEPAAQTELCKRERACCTTKLERLASYVYRSDLSGPCFVLPSYVCWFVVRFGARECYARCPTLCACSSGEIKNDRMHLVA